MATEKWVAGTVGLTWTSAGFSTEVNSLVNSNSCIAASQLDNSTNLDMFCDLSISLGSITTGAGAPFIGMYLYPLNQDGTTYGDANIPAAAATPASMYWVGNIQTPAGHAGAITGTIRNIVMPPGAFKFVLYNASGNTLASSTNTIQYRTYNYSVA